MEKGEKRLLGVILGLALIILVGMAGANTTISNLLVSVQDILALGNVNATNVYTEKLNDVLYVQSGNSTDIQAKLNSCPAIGCRVVVRAGYYNMSNTIYIPSNTTFEGVGKDTIIHLGLADANLISNANLRTGDKNIEIKNMKLDGNKDISSANNGTLFFKNVSNLIIDNIQVVRGQFRAIEVTDVNSNYYVIVRNSRFEDSHLDGIYMHGVHKAIIDGNFIDSAPDSGIDLGGYLGNSNSEFIVTNNIITNGGLGIGVARDARNMLIDSNIIKNGTSHGISLYLVGEDPTGGNTSIVSNNIVFNMSKNGIRVENSHSVVVTGNNLFGNGWRGITVENASYISVTSNNAELNAMEGIYVRYANFTLVNDNMLRRNNYYGLLLEDTSHCLVNGNSAIDNDYGDSNTYAGIGIKGYSYRNFITGNLAYITNPGMYHRYGIYIVQNTSINNTIFGNQLFQSGRVLNLRDYGLNTSLNYNFE